MRNLKYKVRSGVWIEDPKGWLHYVLQILYADDGFLIQHGLSKVPSATARVARAATAPQHRQLFDDPG